MRYFIIVASKDHVLYGVEEGFAQAGHGKKIQLEKLEKGDWIIYYSSKDTYEKGKAYQKFTAVGEVEDEKPFQVKVNPQFEPWRRKIRYSPVRELEIQTVLADLDLITNRKNWGLHLMSGFKEINKHDFDLIAKKMLLDINPQK